MFLTSSQDDPFFSQKYEHVKSELLRGNKAFTRLNFLEADVCLMTTPGLDVYQLKRSKGVKHYAHILHAVDDATSYRLFGLDYFDSVLLSGEYQKEHIRLLEKQRGIKEKELIVVGCPYLDILQEKAKDLLQKRVTSLPYCSPSWGASVSYPIRGFIAGPAGGYDSQLSSDPNRNLDNQKRRYLKHWRVAISTRRIFSGSCSGEPRITVSVCRYHDQRLLWWCYLSTMLPSSTDRFSMSMLPSILDHTTAYDVPSNLEVPDPPSNRRLKLRRRNSLGYGVLLETVGNQTLRENRNAAKQKRGKTRVKVAIGLADFLMQFITMVILS